MRIFTIVAIVAVALLGCPPSTEKKQEPIGACKKVGDQCEYSPGKLGTCVSLDGCPNPPCYLCQSQH